MWSEENPRVLNKAKRKYKAKTTWNLTRELMQREYGMANNFINKCNSSEYTMQHMARTETLNTGFDYDCDVIFNRSGNLVCVYDSSGFAIYDWMKAKQRTLYYVPAPSDSELEFDFTDVKFADSFGYENTLDIFTAASNACIEYRRILPTGVQVILNEISLCDFRPVSNNLITFTLSPQNTNECVCVAEDGGIFYIDFRYRHNSCWPINRVVSFTNSVSLSRNPLRPEIVFWSYDNFVRLYDTRNLSRELKIVFVPSKEELHIFTCHYNFDGTEILMCGSESLLLTNETSKQTKIYKPLFDMCPTIINYFGPRSEYFVTETPGQNIGFINRSTGALAGLIILDEEYTLQVIGAHPTLPLVAAGDVEGGVWMYTTREQL